MAKTHNPTTISAAWARNLGAATQKITAGVQSVTVAPTQIAAQRADAYLQGVQASVQSGKYQAGLQRVTLADWQQSMVQKGIPRIASGATAAQPKMEAFLTSFLPYVEAGQRQLQSMPRGTLQDNINRAVFMMQYNAAYKKK